MYQSRKMLRVWIVAVLMIWCLAAAMEVQAIEKSVIPDEAPFLPGATPSVRAYPTDLTANIPWSGGTAGVSDIQNAFNNARNVENTQLGKTVPALTMPTQTTWNGMSDGQKALWLINRERIDRGVMPLHGIETNVTAVAQYYAQYLIDHNVFSHNADGRTPWQRLYANPAIGACYDSLSVAENLAYLVTTLSSIALPIERSVYMWMYDDADSSWGHRHAILWYPYTDNSGPTGQEGFLGIGRANGPYLGWNYGEVIVMNVFDPCSSWVYLQEQNSYILWTK